MLLLICQILQFQVLVCSVVSRRTVNSLSPAKPARYIPPSIPTLKILHSAGTLEIVVFALETARPGVIVRGAGIHRSREKRRFCAIR
jgi:hypothetical protein